MFQNIANSVQDLCASGLFNNPGKIMEACFGSQHYADPIFNPCTGAIYGMLAGAAIDGLGLFSDSSQADGYYDGGGSSVQTPSSSYVQPSLSDLLSPEYGSDSSLNLSDVVN